MTDRPSDETFLDEMARLLRLYHGLRVEQQDRLLALARRAPALTWQPMETAPKDGTRIVIARLNSGAVWWVTLGEWSEKWGKFWDRVEPSGFNHPTHWMPLPAAPAPEREP